MKIQLKHIFVIFMAINLVLLTVVAILILPPYLFGDNDKIRNLLENPNAPVMFVGEKQNGLNDDRTYLSGSSQISVNKKTGTIDSAFPLGIRISDNGTLSLQQAEESAKSFVGRHYSHFSTRNMQLTESYPMDHGWGVSEYSFRWVEQYQNINTENFVSVFVSAQGTVENYFSHDGPIPPVESPKITHEKAVEIVTRPLLNSMNITKMIKNSTSLSLALSREHQDRLVWEGDFDFEYLTNTSLDKKNPDLTCGRIVIDAMTGEILESHVC